MNLEEDLREEIKKAESNLRVYEWMAFLGMCAAIGTTLAMASIISTLINFGYEQQEIKTMVSIFIYIFISCLILFVIGIIGIELKKSYYKQAVKNLYVAQRSLNKPIEELEV